MASREQAGIAPPSGAEEAVLTGGSWQVVWSATVAVALLTLINGGYRRALEVLYVSELELMPHRHTTID